VGGVAGCEKQGGGQEACGPGHPWGV